MERLKCLGCEGAPILFFFLDLHHLRGAQVKSRTFGACDSCTTPGSATYEAFRQRLGTLMFMHKNTLVGMAAGVDPHVLVDSKTAAAGGDL